MWLVVAALGILLAAAAMYVAIAFDRLPPVLRSYVTPLWEDLSVFPAAVGLLLLVFGIFGWWHVDGVWLLTDRYTHELLYPKRSKR